MSLRYNTSVNNKYIVLMYFLSSTMFHLINITVTFYYVLNMNRIIVCRCFDGEHIVLIHEGDNKLSITISLADVISVLEGYAGMFRT